MLTVHIEELNLKAMVLMILDEIASNCPENIPTDLLLQKLFKDITFDVNVTYYINKLAVTLALYDEVKETF